MGTHFRTAMPNLEKVCAHSGAVFAVFWKLKDDMLQATEHYNPTERIKEVRQKSKEGDLYTTESYKFRIAIGEGIIGKVYASGEKAFYEDVSQLPSDVYIRSEIAKKYDISSVAVMPYEGGVLEIGSIDKWNGFNWSSAACG